MQVNSLSVPNDYAQSLVFSMLVQLLGALAFGFLKNFADKWHPGNFHHRTAGAGTIIAEAQTTRKQKGS